MDWNASKNMIANPQSGWFAPGTPTRDQMDACNQTWLDLLLSLEEGFNGNKQRFLQAVPFMLELKRRVNALMNIPSGIAGTVLGPSFELPEKTTTQP